MNNLHISLTEFRNESRVLKETNSILNNKIASKVYIASLHSDDLEEERIYSDNLILNRFKLKSRNLSKNLFVQVLKYLEFLYRITFFYRKKNIKMVNIHSIALLPFGVFLKYFYRAKLVYDTHELETETGDKSGFRQKIAKFIERNLIKKCDIIFVVSENIADWYEKEYGILRPVVVKNAPKLISVKKTNHFRNNLGIKDNSIILLYQGILSEDRGIGILLECFKQRNNDNIVIVFMGYGEYEQEIKKLGQENNNIFFHHAVEPEVVLEYTSSADIGIIYVEKPCLSYIYSMPNKLFEYATAGLMIMASDNLLEIKDYILSNEIGVLIESDNMNKLNDTLNFIKYSDLEKFKNNALKSMIDNDWSKQEIKLIDEYKRAFNAK